ncbi:protein of unknown function [Methylotuvimicrobium alcaliphilum 20Z]|uniref:Uncharacterized protein n=2 Tax=Methylotuvimicrobium alcaliphilum TaxID=271065 RepID=G4T3X8_META2|nr:protein of unknown function [Methylotuvimicrobium alcaliphilum 20Z]
MNTDSNVEANQGRGGPSSHCSVLRLDEEFLASCLPSVSLTSRVTSGQVTPIRFRLLGQGCSRILQLDMAVDLLPDDAISPLGLHLTLVSNSWATIGDWPPSLPLAESDGLFDERAVECSTMVFSGSMAPDDAASGATGQEAVTYTLHKIDHVMLSSDMPWLRLLHSAGKSQSPACAKLTSLPSGEASLPLADALRQTLLDWLYSQQLTYREGLVNWIATGPIGHFGSVETRVLERTGQADLQVDVTCLAQVRQANNPDIPETCLTLYGERLGTWLLHRNQPKVTKVVNKESQQLLVNEHQEVLIADRLEDLIQQTGLGPLEKRLFKQAKLLPPERLWHTPSLETNQTPEHTCVKRQPEEATLNLSGLDARSRSSLTQLFKWAQQGQLTYLNLDLLYKVARQLSKANRSSF